MLQELYSNVELLIGRPVEVVRTASGKWIVEWLNFNTPPPPVGASEQEALEKFIDFIKENPDGTIYTSNPDTSEEVTGP